MRKIIAASLIFLFWFLLSGHTELLLIVLGIVSTLLTVYISHRMNIIDHESYPFHLSGRLIKYCFYLGKEIVLANWDVIKRIIMPGKSISPCVVTLPVEQTSDLGKVIYANSITLTPGTVTLELTNDKITVHALSKAGADDLLTGTMSSKVPE